LSFYSRGFLIETDYLSNNISTKPVKKMKKLIFVLPFLLLAIFLNAQTTLEEIISDMKLPQEGLPHGVPASYNWQAKPRPGEVEPPAGWTAAIAWGQVYEWAGSSTSTNTRIQIKDLALYYLNKKDNKWHLLQSSVRVSGANYREDFVGDVNKPADIRVESDGSISTTCGGGYNFHFWPSSGRSKFPANEVAGCFVTVKARLIVGDKTKPDDRDQAKYLMSVGGDWWQSLTAPWDNFKTNADMGIGRFRFISNEWKSFNMYSVPADTIRNNPPPFTSVTTGIYDVKETGKIDLKISPVNNIFNIQFSLVKKEKIQLSLFDLNGRIVETVVHNSANAGLNSVVVNQPQEPGIYIVKLFAQNQTAFRKVYVR
jgi:hypothetical protein